MFERQRSGSVVCPGCGRLVGVQNERCPHCGRSSPGLFGYARALQGLTDGERFVPFVIIVCSALYVLTLLVDFRGVSGGGMNVLPASIQALLAFGASGRVPVFELGRWWTPLSASWLHGSLLHILFNMMWVRQLAPAVIRMFGAGRAVLIYLIAGVTGFALTSALGHWMPGLPLRLMGAPYTIGASASVFGLFGALIVYGRRTGTVGLGRQVWTWVGFMVVLGLIMPGVDNWAHFGGLAGGYAVASIFDPLKPERAEHLLGAVVGLVLSMLAIVVSLVHYFAG